MNGLAERNKTLGELLTELRVRLGFVAQGSASKNNEATVACSRTPCVSRAARSRYALASPARA